MCTTILSDVHHKADGPEASLVLYRKMRKCCPLHLDSSGVGLSPEFSEGPAMPQARGIPFQFESSEHKSSDVRFGQKTVDPGHQGKFFIRLDERQVNLLVGVDRREIGHQRKGGFRSGDEGSSRVLPQVAIPMSAS